MAKGEMVVRGDANTAAQSFVNAVTYLGGKVTTMNPSRPVEFSISRTGAMSGGYGAPYDGSATLVPMPNNQTKVLVELKPKLWYTGIFVVIGLVAAGFSSLIADEPELAMTIAAGCLAAVGVLIFLYHVSWPQKVLERILTGVHGAVPAYDAGPAPMQQQQFAPPQPMPQSAMQHQAPPAPSAPANNTAVGDQLRQLAELRQQDLITQEEFEAKRAELLTRL